MNEISKGTRNAGNRSSALTLPGGLAQGANATVRLVSEDGATRAVISTRDAEWVARNRNAMASYDAFVKNEDLILGDLRTFDQKTETP